MKSLPLILLCGLALATGCRPAHEAGAADRPRGYVLATATTGGTYYPVGVAIATLVSIELQQAGVSMRAITSAGSGENIRLLQTGETDFAILQGLFGAMAWTGKGKYEGQPQQQLRSLTMLWENVEHFVVQQRYATSGNIMDLRNLAGENLSIGKRGSGTEGSGRVILSALGFDADADFSLQFMGYGQSGQALQDGRVAAINVPAGPPVAAITQLFSALGPEKLTILSFTPAQLTQITAVYPVWSAYRLAAGTYPRLDRSIETIAQPNFLACNADLDAEHAYLVLKTIYGNLKFLTDSHQATRAMSLDRGLIGLPVPLHPGALRYYEEQGLTVPARLQPPPPEP